MRRLVNWSAISVLILVVGTVAAMAVMAVYGRMTIDPNEGSGMSPSEWLSRYSQVA